MLTSVTNWVEENPNVSLAFGTLAILWLVSQLNAIHLKYSFDEVDESTNLDYPRARRLALAKFPSKFPDYVKVIEEYVEMPDGHMLFTRCYIPKDENNIKGMICYNHGYGDYLGLCVNASLCEFVRRGYMVFAQEHFGHGRSSGLYVYVPDFDQYVQHANFVHTYAKRKYSKLYNIPENAYFISGESLGGEMCILESILHSQLTTAGDVPEWNGFFLIAPMCGLDDNLKIPYVLELVFRYVVLPFVPLAPLESKSFDDFLLSPEAGEDIRNMVFDKVKNPLKLNRKPRFISTKCNVDTARQMIENAHKVTLPFLCVHSISDQITSAQKSKEFYEKAASEDKEYKMYDKGFHMVLHDCMAQQAFHDIQTWMEKRASS